MSRAFNMSRAAIGLVGDTSGNINLNSSGVLGNSVLNVGLGIAVKNVSTSMGYYQTYNGNATTDKKTWRFGGDGSGNLVFETVNDAYSSSTNRMTLDASGNLGLGRVPDSWAKLDVNATSGGLQITGSGYKTNPTGMLLGQYNSTTYYIQKPTGTQLDFWDGATNAQARLDSSGNFNLLNGNLVLASGKGIDFSAGSNASGMATELLDDYESGTWTPTLNNGGTVNSIYFATYVKIGRLVTINFYITCTPTNNASRFEIAGLPFANNAATNNYTAGTLGYTGSLNATNWHGPIVAAGTTFLYFHMNNSTATVVNSAFGGAANEIIVSASYHSV